MLPSRAEAHVALVWVAGVPEGLGAPPVVPASCGASSPPGRNVVVVLLLLLLLLLLLRAAATAICEQARAHGTKRKGADSCQSRAFKWAQGHAGAKGGRVRSMRRVRPC